LELAKTLGVRHDAMTHIRPLVRSDIAAVHALEAEAYDAPLHVSDAAFVALIDRFPDGAIGAFDEDGLCGFIFGVPLRSGTTLDLVAPLAEVPEGADVFYVHDIAVAGRSRAVGLGRALAERLLDVARANGFTRAELVSVQGSAPFWEKLGFRAEHTFEYAPGAASTRMSSAIGPSTRFQ
jgi:predicted N-acetyltransferase YhbS